MPNLDPAVRKYFLQGVGQSLFVAPPVHVWIAPRDFPPPYEQDLLTGWGMALGNFELVSNLPWKGPDSPFWSAWIRGLSSSNLEAIQDGKAQFDEIFQEKLIGAEI